MRYALSVCLQDEDKIAAFSMNADTGQLTAQAELPASGRPSVLAISPDRHVLYVGHRIRPTISSCRIDPDTGGLTPQGTVSAAHAPTFLTTDRSGRYLLSAYYQGGVRQFIPSERMARWVPLPLTGWRRPRAPTQYRPTPQTGLPSCRTSRA